MKLKSKVNNCIGRKVMNNTHLKSKVNNWGLQGADTGVYILLERAVHKPVPCSATQHKAVQSSAGQC